jgi:uncharacterized membrane protein YkoI
MPVSRLISLALLSGLMAGPTLAADAPHRACLNKAEQRAAVAGHLAMPLAEVVKRLHGHIRRGELLRARLCHRGESLVYVLTLLKRSGKVTRASVDAANGELIKGH